MPAAACAGIVDGLANEKPGCSIVALESVLIFAWIAALVFEHYAYVDSVFRIELHWY